MPTSISDLETGTTRLKAEILRRLTGEGFEAVGVTGPGGLAEAGARLNRFLELGRHGDMDWMAEKRARRVDPAALWPEARSIVVAAMNYGPSADPLAPLAEAGGGTISVYAQGRDYHDVLKKKLKKVARWIHGSQGAGVKVFVDTAPVLEKPLAALAGLGWQGKHTNLVSRQFGSWLFLGSIFTTLDLAPDEAAGDACGSCRACLEVCPTGAFPAPYQIDARRCISYLTIEHKDHIPAEFRAAMCNRVYGCDDCLAVCPWNKYAATAREHAFHARDELSAPRLGHLAGLDDEAFRKLFARSPVKRLGRDRFVRNVLIALANSGDPGAAKVAEARLDDASPLVRAMAVWALGRLAPGPRLAALKSRHRNNENDAAVRAEWEAF